MPPVSKKQGKRGIREGVKRGATEENLEKLTVQQKSFILHYLADPALNAEAAARKAGYTGAGSGTKLLRNPTVSREISFQIAKRNEALELKAEDVIVELKHMAFRDIIDLCDESGKINLTDLRKIPAHIRKCIDGLKIKTGYDLDGNQVLTVDLKLVPKIEAMQLLMKHLGMLEPDGMRKVTDPNEGKNVLDWDELYNPPAIGYDPVEAELDKLRKEVAQDGS